MQIVDTFSGIGGFSLAGKWIGWRTVQFCEINKFCQKVLSYYWPEVPIHDDIKTLTALQIKNNGLYDPTESTILVGGVPCQPWSTAGKRLGEKDDRNLWPQTIRLIGELKPDFALLENVRGFTNWNGGMVFDQVQADLEAEGYEVLPFLLPACAVNAPHRRDRIWIVAHRTGERLEGGTKFKEGRIQPAKRDKQAIENTDQDGWGGIEREEEPKERGFGDVGTGDNERVRADNEDIGLTPDTQSLRSDRTQEYEDGDRQGREWRGCDAYNDGEVRRPTPDTGGIESQGGMHPNGRGQTERHTSPRNTRTIQRGTWDNFPTQPPVRQRNDGLSPELDGITVSRHRKESIMAYGNAIVPQVAFELFKVINAIKNPYQDLEK